MDNLEVSGSTKWTVQTDMKYDNMLVLDDPNAEIVLDMNGCGLARETGRYDEALFDICAGSLRIISKSVATPTDSSNNLHFQVLQARTVYSVSMKEHRYV